METKNLSLIKKNFKYGKNQFVHVMRGDTSDIAIIESVTTRYDEDGPETKVRVYFLKSVVSKERYEVIESCIVGLVKNIDIVEQLYLK